MERGRELPKDLRIAALEWSMGGVSVCSNINEPRNVNKFSLKNVRQKYEGNCEYIGSEVMGHALDLLNGEAKRADVIFITTVDEASERSYLHNNVLPDYLSPQGYTLLKRAKLDIGEKQVGGQNLLNRKGYLRVSTYVHNDVAETFEEGEAVITRAAKNTHLRNGDKNQYKVFCDISGTRQGAIGTYIFSSIYGSICAISFHFPIGSVIQGTEEQKKNTRETQTRQKEICMNSFLKHFVRSPNNTKGFSVENVVIMGNINSHIVENTGKVLPRESVIDFISRGAYRELASKDELSNMLHGYPFEEDIFDYNEGVNGIPEFPPSSILKSRDTCTYNGIKDKSAGNMKTECYNENITPMYTDRILYGTRKSGHQGRGYSLHCEGYNLFYDPKVSVGGHAAVFSNLILTKDISAPAGQRPNVKLTKTNQQGMQESNPSQGMQGMQDSQLPNRGNMGTGMDTKEV